MVTTSSFLLIISNAATALRERKEEINKLNVFPVPDGDTGTNMSLTIDTMVEEVARLSKDAGLDEVRSAVTHGSLMGARGNSGVITSQILRGACEGLEGATEPSAEVVAVALEKAVEVAFKAVRKPVEGTMLTVIKDTALAARECADAGFGFEDAVVKISEAAFASVRNTPNLLPVLKENNVVDAGGFGLAILIEAMAAGVTGQIIEVPDAAALSYGTPTVAIERNNDWDPDSEFPYCTEFLFTGTNVDEDEIRDHLASVGDCDLFVGSEPQYKAHVHTNDPGAVLSFMTARGEIAEVYIHNMKLQADDRDAQLEDEAANAPKKPLGFVAVAAGSGLATILKSLGVDKVVSGGQTMNPSTKDLAEAIASVNADAVIVLPNNKNIIMAAQAAADISPTKAYVVPTTSVPEAFSALFAIDAEAEIEDIVAEMKEAASEVHVGEITKAIKDSKTKHDQPIKNGDIIGISDHEIEVVGKKIEDVALELIASLLVDDGETLTILAGEDFTDRQLKSFVKKVEAAYPDFEVDTHRGEQPLYPLILAVE